MAKECRHLCERTSNHIHEMYEYDVEINDDDVIRVVSHNTFIELEVGGETVHNIELTEKSKIKVKVIINIDTGE